VAARRAGLSSTIEIKTTILLWQFLA